MDPAKIQTAMMVFWLAIVGHGACKKADGNFWQKVDGKVLVNSLLVKLDRVTCIQCLLKCTAIDECKSINYIASTSFCELNKNDSRDSNVTFEAREEWTYYEILQQPAVNQSPVSDCLRSSPCKFGTCKDVSGGSGYNCTCNKGYTGSNCDIIDSGLRPETAASSCLEIRHQHGEVAPPSGMYWIKAAQPVQMLCDMEVDGGGWTKVGNVNITSDGYRYSKSLVEDAVSSLDMIERPYYVLSTSGLASLRQLIGFKSIRMHCNKPSVRRTVHISTATNSSGIAVVDYMTGAVTTRPLACNSFVKLPDDSSELSKNCHRWSNQQWSSSGVNPASLLHCYPAEIKNYHNLVVGCYLNEFMCDDVNQESRIGFWKFYVR